MASLVFTRFLVNCDGCRAIFGTQLGFASLTEARAAAYAKGWRFPNMLTKSGTHAAATNDVCPACAGEWQPETAGSKLNHQRALLHAEVLALPLEATP